MVLVSFEKKFIFTKTIKTAGTSVEIFFEPYCLPPEGYVQTHAHDETITDYGIVGFRGSGRPADTLWYNHMPAAQIREYLGPEVWNECFKFCTIRNPFDKLVSMYSFQMSRRKQSATGPEFSDLRREFLIWVKQRGFVQDRDKYMIDGAVCVDYFIRFENLFDDLAAVCRKLEIERDVSELERFKSRSRRDDRHFSEFYDAEARQIVADAYAFELDRFEYELLD